MNILIGVNEVCGILNTYANAFIKIGHNVTTVISERDKFFDLDYNVDLYNLHYSFYYHRFKNKFFAKILAKISLLTGNFINFRKQIIYHLIDQHEIFIFLWGGKSLLPDNSDLELIKVKNKKIIYLLLGSDVRHYAAFNYEYKIDQDFTFPDEYVSTSIDKQIRNLRIVELYSNLILSVPDQAGLAIRPYNHLHIPLNLDKYTFRNNQREIPVIVHAPSKPYLKGTDIILQTLQQLKSEGLKFELKHIENCKNNELIEILKDADILVDELVFHGPGVIAFEAMACGCAVATKYLEPYSDIFSPPVISITPQNIYEQVKILITDQNKREQLILKGRKYVENNNSNTILADRMLKLLDQVEKKDIKYDYHPKIYIQYLANQYKKNISLETQNLEKRVIQNLENEY